MELRCCYLFLALSLLAQQEPLLVNAFLPSRQTPSVTSVSSPPISTPTALSSTKDTKRAERRKRAKPIDPSYWPQRYPAKDLCSRCGLCETSFVADVKDACAFLGPGMNRIDTMEEMVHGRNRKHLSAEDFCPSEVDEARFGVLHEPVRLAKGSRIQNAQWTGVVTGIALSMLESNKVDAVVCIANGADGNFGSPEPILAKTPEDVLKGRGVKPALAPSLKVLDDIQKDPTIRRLLFCGVGCAVQAFRAVQSELNLEEVYVLGTNCADNSPTPQAARNFVANGVGLDDATAVEDVQGYEFMQDFKVHVKSKDSYIKKPYFTLPGTIAESSIAKSCRACFDYTNALADVVVGYMGAPLDGKSDRMDDSHQTLTVRNEKGAEMVRIAQQANRLVVGDLALGTGNHEKLASATVTSDAIVNAMVDQPVPERGMPGWLGEVMAFGMTAMGPKGMNFARYSIDYHVLRNYLFVLHQKRGNPTAAKAVLPQNARDVVDHFLQTDPAFAELESKVIQQTMGGGKRP